MGTSETVIGTLLIFGAGLSFHGTTAIFTAEFIRFSRGLVFLLASAIRAESLWRVILGSSARGLYLFLSLH